MENEKKAKSFLDFVSRHLDEYKKKWMKYFSEKDLNFSEDIFSETILKIYDYILKNGLKDCSDKGFANYFFKSFLINSKREKQYSRNSLRDFNLDASDVLSLRENGKEELDEKIKKQIFEDYLTVKVLQIVESKFSTLDFSLFRLYFLNKDVTYVKLKEISKIPDCKKRVVAIKKYLQSNLSLKDIKKEFDEYYDN